MRNSYRDFIKECIESDPELKIECAYSNFCILAKLWTGVSEEICSSGEKKRKENLVYVCTKCHRAIEWRNVEVVLECFSF